MHEQNLFCLEGPLPRSMKMMNAMTTFLRDEKGATAIEYGLIVGLISVAIIGTATLLGTEISSLFTKITNKLATIK